MTPPGRSGPRRVWWVAPVLLVGAAVPLDGQWVSEPGAGWVDVTLIHHDTAREYDPLGEERDMFADGRAVTRSLFITGTVGVWDGVDVWAQLPFHRLRFNDAGGERVSTGPGDPALFLRVGSSVWDRLPEWPVALRAGVKLDVGSFDVDPEIVPLSEGQVDWELLLEIGRSFYPLPVWTGGWVGYRWRMENTDLVRKPGDEIFWLWSAGGELGGGAGWQVTLEGLSGGAWQAGSLRIGRARRELHQLFVTGTYSVGPGTGSAGVRLPLSGRNLPAGTAFVAGYFLQWGP